MPFVIRDRFDFAPFTTLATLAGFSHYVLLIHKVWTIGSSMEVRPALFPSTPFAHAAFGT
jgi:hypothetical protein